MEDFLFNEDLAREIVTGVAALIVLRILNCYCADSDQ